jgi:hypothetical protein
LSKAYIEFPTNSQDVSAFYLSQLYQLQAGLNGSVSSPTPAPPALAATPYASYWLWFMSLTISFVCAVGATMVQEWIRRYQLLTQLWSNPQCSSARIQASLLRDRFLEIVPAFLKSLNLLLHSSIYFFLAGLTFLPFTYGDWPTFGFAIVCFVLAVVGYFFVANGWGFRPCSIFFPMLLIYGRDLRVAFPFRCYPFFRWPTLLQAVQKIKEDASTRTSTLDADAMSWLLDSLTEEEEFEQFLAGIPGFYKSTQVEEPAKVLQQINTDRSPKAILAFMDRSLSSNLSEETRQRQMEVSVTAMQTDPYLLRRSFYHALLVCSSESAIFKSINFVLLADQHTNNEDLNTRSLARCIMAIAINRLEDYDAGRDKRWAGIVQRRLNWPVDYGIKLHNLMQLIRDLNTPHPDSGTLSQEVLCSG